MTLMMVAEYFISNICFSVVALPFLSQYCQPEHNKIDSKLVSNLAIA